MDHKSRQKQERLIKLKSCDNPPLLIIAESRGLELFPSLSQRKNHIQNDRVLQLICKKYELSKIQILINIYVKKDSQNNL